MLKSWKPILVLTLVGGVLGALVSLVVPPVYESSVTLLPQRDDSSANTLMNRLSGIVGMSVSDDDTLEDLYRTILHSDRLLTPLLSESWPSSVSPEPTSLYAALGLSTGATDRDTLETMAKAVEKLTNTVVQFERDKSNGFMKLSVELKHDPVLVQAVASRLASDLDSFLADYHSQHTSRQRLFVASRLDTIASELKLTEQVLADYVESNRMYNDSPELLRRYEELKRRVHAKHSVWVELSGQLEMARIKEHDRQYRLNVLDLADLPAHPVSPKASIYGLMGALLSLSSAMVLVANGISLPEFRMGRQGNAD